MHIKYLAGCFAVVGAVAMLPTGSLAYAGEKPRAGALNSAESSSRSYTDEELEKEKGGSGLRYSFDIKSGRVVYEVGVDAQKAA